MAILTHARETRAREHMQRPMKSRFLYIPAVRNYCVIHSRDKDSSLVAP